MKKKCILLMTIGLAALSSCSSDEEEKYPEVHIDVVTSGESGSRSTPVVPNGGSGSTTTFNSNDQIKVQKGSETPKTYTYSGTSWSTTDGAMTWTVGGVTNTFKAWYPTTATYDAFTLPSDQSSATKIAAADYMKASKSETWSTGKVLTLQMQRQTALVTFTIKKFNFVGSGSQTPKITSFKVYSLYGGIPSTSHNSIKEIAPFGYIKPGNSCFVAGGVNYSYSAILIPCAASAPTSFISLSYTDKSGAAHTGLIFNGIPELKAGYKYEFDVSVDKTIQVTGTKSGYNYENFPGVVKPGYEGELLQNSDKPDYGYVRI